VTEASANDSSTSCEAIVLAAGASSRLSSRGGSSGGSSKALLRLAGQTLLERTIDAVRGAGASPLVVLGADAERVRLHTDGARVLINPQWAQGMGTSIAWGMAALDETTERVLVLAVDQPRVDADLLAELIEACDESVDAAATRYANGVVGVPACFRRSLFGQLSALDGDRGARRLLRSGEHRIAEVAADGAGVDIDTRKQWRAFLDQYDDEDHGGRR
jgi:CTP:molybdopterin cytidylyltransferase MocA